MLPKTHIVVCHIPLIVVVAVVCSATIYNLKVNNSNLNVFTCDK